MGIAGEILTARKGQLEWQGDYLGNHSLKWLINLNSLEGKEKGTGACDEDDG